MKITRCQTCHMTNPLGYAFDKPVFSFVVEDENGIRQTGARICVSKNPDMSDSIYDSFKEDMDDLACKADIELEPRTRYYWTAAVHTDGGDEIQSEVNWFETGKMAEPWSARWITCDSREPRHPVFAKKLTATKEVKRARLYISGLGLYEAHIDGVRVGDEYLTPYCNDYNTWIQYQTYDISDMLKAGSMLEVTLGNGWYKGRFGFEGNRGDLPRYSNEWKLIAEIHIDYADGTSETVGTDNTWTVNRSQIYFSNIYDGEEVDASLPQLPPEAADFCDETLAPLTARLSQPVRERENFPVKELIHTPAGETVLDIGQNIAGTFRLKVDIPKGEKVHLQVGEVLQGGNFYNDNLRTAQAAYTWISDGTPQVLQPRFTFYGYRYVKVEGVPNLKQEDFTGIALYSEIPPVGTLKTGNELVNKLISNTQWGQKGNFVDVPTDCPQRDERMGWTGDAQVFAPTACYLTDAYAFYTKYLYDLVKEQGEKDGLVPDYIPTFGYCSSSAVWGDLACIMPWDLYVFYGDTGVLSAQYDSMKDWVGYIERVDGNDCGWRRHTHYGDWLALDNPAGGVDQVQGGTDKGFIADVYYYNDLCIIARTARILGQKEDRVYYEKWAQRILKRIRDEYYSSTGRCCVDTQTAHLLTIKFGLSENIEGAKKALINSLERVGNKLQTGFVGTPFLCNILSDIGETDRAYKLLLNEEYPGWLYEVNLGATTVWERWNSVEADGSISSTGMNSLNHYAYGSIVEWIWRHAAGINPCEEKPGFKKVRFIPSPNWELGHIEAQYSSPSGVYKSAWKILGDTKLEVSVTVPFGCEAELVLPLAGGGVFGGDSPVTANVKDGVCMLEPGDYSIVYETSVSMKPEA